jgi:hypothetical protein
MRRFRMNLQVDSARSCGQTWTSMTASLTSRIPALGGLVVLLIVVIVPL